MFNKRIEEKKKKKKKRTLRPHGRLWYQSSTSATKHSECKMQRQNIEREKKKKIKKIIKSMDPSYFSKETVSLVKPPTSRA